MSSGYTLHIRTSPTGGDLIRTDGRIMSLTFAYDAHGCAELTASLHVSIDMAYRVYDQPGLLYIIVCYAGAVVWAGRLEEATVSSKGLRIVAAGYWQAFKDALYTALWSSTKVSEFRPILQTEVSDCRPDRYTTDTNNRIYITANKNATLGNTTSNKAGRMGYVAPDQGQRLITNISFDYSFSSQTNWAVGLQSFDSSWGGAVGLWSLAGAGAGVVTGSQSITLGATRERLAFYLFYNAADAVLALETGDVYLRITNIRIKTTTGTVYGSDIVTALASYVTGINGQLAGSIVAATSLDLQDEQYDDQAPSDIIERLATIDSVRAYVDSQRAFWYGATATGSWQLDIADIEIQRPLDRVFNQAYGVYQDASNRTLRTANANNTYSQSRYGAIRSQAVAVRSTSSSQASSQRDTSLSDAALPAPRAGLTIRRILDSNGRPTLAHLPRPGDLATIPNLPPSLSTDIDQIRTFTIGRTQIHLEHGHAPEVTIEPNEPVPSLTTMLARIAAT